MQFCVWNILHHFDTGLQWFSLPLLIHVSISWWYIHMRSYITVNQSTQCHTLEIRGVQMPACGPDLDRTPCHLALHTIPRSPIPMHRVWESEHRGPIQASRPDGDRAGLWPWSHCLGLGEVAQSPGALIPAHKAGQGSARSRDPAPGKQDQAEAVWGLGLQSQHVRPIASGTGIWGST